MTKCKVAFCWWAYLLTAAALPGATNPNLMFTPCCHDGSSVSVIDTVANVVKASIPLGQGVSLGAFSPDGKMIYYFDSADYNIYFVEATTGALVRTIATPQMNSGGMLVTKDGSAIYIALGSALAAYSTADGSLLANFPLPAFISGLTQSPDGSTVFSVADVPNSDLASSPALSSSVLEAVSTATRTVAGVARIPFDSQAIAVTPDGSTVWITLAADSTHGAGLESLDAKTLRPKATIADTLGPAVVSVTPDGAFLVVGETNDAVRFYSASTSELMGQATTAGAASAIAVQPDSSAVYVAIGAADSVQAISVPGFVVTKSLNVGNSPSSLTLDPESGKLQVTNRNPSTVITANLGAARAVGYQAALHEPYQFASGPHGTVYVTEYASNSVAQLSAAGQILARIPVERNPEHLVASPDGARLYVANRLGQDGFTPSISVIDTATNSVTNRWDVTGGSNEQSAVAVSPDGATLYVASVSLFAYNAATGALSKSVSVPNDNLYFVAAMLDGLTVYASGLAGVYQIDSETFKVISQRTFGDGCFLPLTLRPDGKELWVADSDDMTIGVIDTADNSLTPIAMTTSPLWIAFTSDSATGLVATGSGLCVVTGGPVPGASILSYDTSTHSATGSIAAGGPTVGVISLR